MAARILKGPGSQPGQGDNGGGDIRERVAKLEAHMEHVATKAWVLGGVLGGMGVAAGVAVGLAQLILKSASD